MNSTIKIDKKRYVDLLLAEAELNMLEGGGVYNWDWYWESRYGEDLPETLDEIEASLKKEYGIE